MNLQPGYPIAITPRQGFVDHVQWSGDNAILSPPECRELIQIGENSGNLAPAWVGDPGNSRLDPSVRRVEACSILMEDALWLYKRIADRVQTANDAYYNFDLTGLMEPVQFLKYKTAEKEEEGNGHYGWHQDFGSGNMASRKLSMVIQLSEPSTYKGCDLHWMTHGEWESRYKGQGEAIMFPSWTPHRVLPITEGIRYALAVWIHGPRLK